MGCTSHLPGSQVPVSVPPIHLFNCACKPHNPPSWAPCKIRSQKPLFCRDSVTLKIVAVCHLSYLAGYQSPVHLPPTDCLLSADSPHHLPVRPHARDGPRNDHCCSGGTERALSAWLHSDVTHCGRLHVGLPGAAVGKDPDPARGRGGFRWGDGGG